MINSKAFFIDKRGKTYTYPDLLSYVNNCTAVVRFSYRQEVAQVFFDIIAAMAYSEDLVLLDSDFSEHELNAMGIQKNTISETKAIIPQSFSGVEHLINHISGKSDWKLTLYTSGTTGLPKKVSHPLSQLSRSVRKGEVHLNDVWALAYNPTHIAGIQVLFQALFNLNSIVDVFNLNRADVLSAVSKYGITHISATPTFYRLLMPADFILKSVKRITSGGERFDGMLIGALLQSFPNARIKNVYASTEAGSVLESDSDVFEIKDTSKVKIVSNRIFVHRRLLGITGLNEEWYDTGDVVEVISENPFRFIIRHRDNEMINVGGNKVNPNEVEGQIRELPQVIQVLVYAMKNSITGNILVADVVLNNDLTEIAIRSFLKDRLQNYKIPRMINIVDSIATTRTGKVQRSLT